MSGKTSSGPVNPFLRLLWPREPHHSYSHRLGRPARVLLAHTWYILPNEVIFSNYQQRYRDFGSGLSLRDSKADFDLKEVIFLLEPLQEDKCATIVWIIIMPTVKITL